MKKMKQNIALVLSIIALVGLAYLLSTKNNNSNIAYVETSVLIEGYEGTKVARKQFEEKSKVWQANTDTLMAQWKNELKAYEKERVNMSEKEIKLKEELLSNKQQQLAQYQEAMKRKAQEEDQNMTSTVMNDINDYLKEYGKKTGYTYILGANGGNIVYANEAENITEVVLNGLNLEYKGK